MAATAATRRIIDTAQDFYVGATAYLSDTLDWFKLWQSNADSDGEAAARFDADTNFLSPHL